MAYYPMACRIPMINVAVAVAPTDHAWFKRFAISGIHTIGLAVPRCIASRKMSEPRASP